MIELNLHPACDIWPVMPEAELAELAADIKANGLIETIVLMSDGSLLDGRNRWLACERVGVMQRTRLFGSEPTDGDNPIRFVISKNKNRRHMSYAEKCFAAEALATLAHGSNQYGQKVDPSNEGSTPVSTIEAAKSFGIGLSGVEDARAIRKYAPELVEQVIKGEKPIRATSDAVRARKKGAIGDTPPKIEVLSEAALKREAMWRNRPILKAVDNGRPTGAEALEQAPGYPPGHTKGMVWTETNGRVVTTSLEERARTKLYERLIEFNALIRKLVNAEAAWPTYDDLAMLDTRRRNNALHEWSKHRVALYALLDAAIGHSKMSATDDCRIPNSAPGER